MPLARAQAFQAGVERQVHRYDIKPVQSDPNRDMTRTLGDVLETLKGLRDDRKRIKANPGLRRAADQASLDSRLESLVGMKKTLETLEAAGRLGFQETTDHIATHNLPRVIMQRHKEAMADFESNFAALKQELATIIGKGKNGDVDAELASALKRLEPETPYYRQHFDRSGDLPFGITSRTTRKPLTSKAELEARVLGLEPGVAKAGVSVAKAPPGPADLAETIDAEQSDEIKALAAELNHNPVEIYNWVHNHIEFLPTYGSIQGADLTLQLRRGNGFDTASLLVALLRASQIPARYVYGTVDVPVDQVLNWVGNITDPEAAQNFMGQGGIPSVGNIRNGVLTDIRMEHVWVEAFVDFFPSRGAVNRNGDSWIPMDASFKQYEYTDAVDFSNEIQAEATLAELMSHMQVDETGYIVENMDLTAIQAVMEQVKGRMMARIETVPDAVPEDFVGRHVLRVTDERVLHAGLPYKLVAETNRVSELPDTLRQKFAVDIIDTYGESQFHYAENTTRLGSGSLGLSFAPATDADASALISYTRGDFNRIPSLPGYLMNFRLQMTLDDELVAQGPVRKMGEDLTLRMGYYTPGEGWKYTNSGIVVGEFHAIGLDLQGGGSPKRGAEIHKGINMLGQLNQGDDLPTGMNKLDWGSMYQTGVYVYLGLSDFLQEALFRSSGMAHGRLPSYGAVSSNASVEYAFGFPRYVTFNGLGVDIPHWNSMGVSKTNDHEMLVKANVLSGMVGSLLESWVPEQLVNLGNDGERIQGASSISLISAAAQSGQKIYRIDSDNIGEILPVLNLASDVKSDIAAAVGEGRVAFAHEHNLEIDGWVGAGYILLDLDTGAGAYMISGGANGGALVMTILIVVGLALLIAALFLLMPLAPIGLATLGAGSAIAAGITSLGAGATTLGIMVAGIGALLLGGGLLGAHQQGMGFPLDQLMTVILGVAGALFIGTLGGAIVLLLGALWFLYTSIREFVSEESFAKALAMPPIRNLKPVLAQ